MERCCVATDAADLPEDKAHFVQRAEDEEKLAIDITQHHHTTLVDSPKVCYADEVHMNVVETRR